MTVFKLVSRKKWGAHPPKSTEHRSTPFRSVNYVFSNTDRCHTEEECSKLLQKMQKQSFDIGLPDVPYNFLIGGDETVYEGRGWYNKVEGDELVIGYLSQHVERKDTDDYLIDAMYTTFEILQYGIDNNYVTEVVTFPFPNDF